MKPRRIVAIGDLNAADDALIEILRGTGLVDRHLSWRGGRSELVQVGDLFNRGGGALAALRRLLRLKREARRAGGNVTILLGNHEVMTALRHEGYCTEAEYLSFATAAERRVWPARAERAFRRLLRNRSRGVVLPLAPRFEAWKAEHVPGQAALRRSLGPHGSVGKALRRLPVAYQVDGALFVHAGLQPEWAQLGIEGLNESAREAWQLAGARPLWKLPKKNLFRNPDGPLWDRRLVRGSPNAKLALVRSLALVGAERMIVGHTQTGSLAGGREGHIQLVAGSRLVAIDVGLASGPGAPRAALIIEDRSGFEWTPARTTTLWSSRGPKR